MRFPPRAHRFCRPAAGFTLVEMLVVMAIITSLIVLTVPAITSLNGSRSFNSDVARMSDLIEEAQAAALANNTYVWMGFYQMPANGGTGVAFVYVPSGNPADFLPGNATPASSRPLGKPVVLLNLSVTTITAAQISDPNRTTKFVGQLSNSSNVIQLTDANNQPQTAHFAGLFAGVSQNIVSGGTQPFSAIMEITPSGQVLISSNSKYACIEIGLVPNKPNAKESAALQINAFTGRVTEFHS